MKLSDFDFDLPEELIALRPLRPRPASRLLVAEGAALLDSQVSQLTQHLRSGDLLVLNDTRVIPARLRGVRRREGGGEAQIETTLLSVMPNGEWRALARPGKRLAVGDVITFSPHLSSRVEEKQGGEIFLRFSADGEDFTTLLDDLGEMPLPPYIASKRQVDAQDRSDYQSVFAKRNGAVAAPTASLHFDERLLEALRDHGVRTAFVTLHVGAGTFLPVTVDEIDDHRMHAEWGEMSLETAQIINETKRDGGRVIPVGTTALRVVETAARIAGQVAPWNGLTDIFIRPGYEFKVADGLMTNFHLPRSTLLMLVSALMGVERMRAIYSHAIDHEYRFFSYGDSSLLLP